jgi:N-acetylglucosamine-6-phosphate deacetylase
MKSRLVALTSKQLVVPYGVINNGVVLIKEGKILQVGRRDNFLIPENTELLNFGDKIIAPGFIDIHIHGVLGEWAQESPQSTINLAEHIIQDGTTSFLPTLQDPLGIINVLKAKELQDKKTFTGAQIVGIHMEGPFLIPTTPLESEYKEIHLREFSMELFDEMLSAAKGLINIMCVSIELNRADTLISEIRKAGILPAIAHTRETYDAFNRSVDLGIRHATHMFNVMSGMHHRRPNVVGGVLTNDLVTCELIADGFHVHPAVMDVLIRCKGPEKIALITDMTIGGLPDGEYDGYFIKDGLTWVKGVDTNKDNTIAGSGKSLATGIKNIIDLGYPLYKAVNMASLIPAKIASVDNCKGSIEPGKDADVVVFNEKVEVEMVMLCGDIVKRVG